MIPRRWLTVLLLVVIFIASFLLRDSIQHIIILPLAYLWWLLKLYYRAVPQVIVWALLVIASICLHASAGANKKSLPS